MKAACAYPGAELSAEQNIFGSSDPTILRSSTTGVASLYKPEIFRQQRRALPGSRRSNKLFERKALSSSRDFVEPIVTSSPLYEIPAHHDSYRATITYVEG